MPREIDLPSVMIDSWRYCYDLPAFFFFNVPSSSTCEVLARPSTMISDSCHASCKSKSHGFLVEIELQGGALWMILKLCVY